MAEKNLIQKVGDFANNLVAGALGVDAIRNLYTGIVTGNESYYQLAVVEATISGGIELHKYIDNRFEKKGKKHLDNFKIYHIPEIKRLDN